MRVSNLQYRLSTYFAAVKWLILEIEVANRVGHCVQRKQQYMHTAKRCERGYQKSPPIRKENRRIHPTFLEPNASREDSSVQVLRSS